MYRYSLLLLLFLAISSCQDFLDREPLDQLTSESFYQTESDGNAAMLACYSVLQDIDWFGKGWMMLEVPGDNSQPGGTDPEFSPIDNFTVNGDTPPVGAYWAIRYRLITYANVFIHKIPDMEIEQSLKDQFDAEARFLRALAYFDLVRIYGDVPLITEPPVYGEDLLFPRSTVNEVYDLIRSDLTAGAEHLPALWSGANVGRANKWAAAALLAKVHLTRREFGKARDRALEVVNSGVYRLMDNYGDNWELATSDNNTESIFQIQYTGCSGWGTGNAMQAFFAPWGEGITKDRDGWGSQIPTSPVNNNPSTTITDAFEEGDLRKDPSIMTPLAYYPSVNPDDGGYTYPQNGASASLTNIKKYVVGSGSDICFMSTPMNAHILRYADVLLILAEALMEIQGGETSAGEALQYFNEVRQRAGLEPLDYINRELMLHERRVEFAFENQRWFDLVRTGKAVEMLTLHGKNIQPHHVLFPIPSAELDINPKLTQNPGY
ncbi:MAG: RagB/SusD family nutrient uptake outer membrane protein [Bacteroidota bacterium]